MNYTTSPFEMDKQAHGLYHIIGFPTVQNFKGLLINNTIANCPITIEDVYISENIFGPDVSILKGKSTRNKSKPFQRDDI